jgi:RNA polymerase sigma-54 factor
MSLAPRLDLRQSQSLVMTPQLQQAIKLLALSNLEIESFLAEEIEKNPLLDSVPAEERPEPNQDHAAAAPATEGTGADELIRGDAIAEAPLDIDQDHENLHQDSAADRVHEAGPSLGDGGSGSGGAGPEDGTDFDSFAGAGMSLHDHLLAQAGEAFAGSDLVIARAIVEQIEETGYLSVPLLDIAQRLGAPVARVEAVLARIQTFDPSGVGARNLAECLAIQAREADRYDPAMAALIGHLDLLARGNLAALRRVCGVDEEDLADMIRELRGYDPKPGCSFATENVASVVPDIFVQRTRAGWAVELNAATLPRVLVDRSYYVELSAARQDKTSRAWLSDCLASANWLVKALDQRARTIVKVATEIVKQQEAFFAHGVEQLRPLTLRTVADAIEMHESTVSRVTSNKYLSCARGTFELKYFFTSAIQSSEGGDAVSAQAVKSHIAKLIAAEDPAAILSDDTLVTLLRERGFDIARRTVAKYREALGLGSSVQRRRQQAISGARAA